MGLQFTKFHGCGNDFVVVDAREIDLDWPSYAIAMTDRRFGVGADGLLLLCGSDIASFKMRTFNPDGSESEMCGNGIRCIGKYAIDNRIVSAHTSVDIETGGRIVQLQPVVEFGSVVAARVAMGIPKFSTLEDLGSSGVLEQPLVVDELSLELTFVSMGNPHAVAILDAPVDAFPLAHIGPLVEHHPIFLHRTNLEVANVLDRGTMHLRVWERSAGMTLACGSGACAAMAVAKTRGLVNNKVDVRLPGGTLLIEWDGSGQVFMTGPAEEVFRGEWNENNVG